MSKKIYKETYFQHDHYARRDPKIKNMLAHFRKENELKAQASVCVFWWIIEDMHMQDYPIANLETFADDYRCDIEFLKSILEDFELFRKENDCYISDRVLRNLNKQKEKVEQKQEAANSKWLLHDFNKAYIEFFSEEPVLMPNEIEALKKYNKKIPNLKNKLRDIIYTMTFIKFDTKFEFKQRANWLLAKNNLARVLNGEFGKLKHKKTEKELKQEQEQLALQQAQNSQPSEFELKMEKIQDKTQALEFIKNELKGKRLNYRNNTIIGILNLRTLMKKFDISDQEVWQKYQHSLQGEISD